MKEFKPEGMSQRHAVRLIGEDRRVWSVKLDMDTLIRTA